MDPGPLSPFELAWKSLAFTDGSLLDTPRSITLKDSHLTYKTGQPNTALEQAQLFVALLERLAKKSSVIQELVVEIVAKCPITNPITLYFGKHSVACFDSAAQWEVDMDDYIYIPEEPYKDPKSGDTVGHPVGEMLIHLLEERLYMQKPGNEFTKSHMKCLSIGSYQNRYRAEIGCTHPALSFDLHQHTAKNTVLELSNWEGVDANGNVMYINNINTGKMLNKFHRGAKCLYKPNPNQVAFSKLDLSRFIETKITAYVGFCRDQFQRNQTVQVEDIIGLEFWVRWASKSEEEYNRRRITLIGPLTIGLSRRKTWNVLRVAVRGRMYDAPQLITLGNNTFLQNHKEPIPHGWKDLEYPMESEINGYKEGIRKNMVSLYGTTEEQALQILLEAEKYF